MVKVMKWVAGLSAGLLFLCLGVGIFAVWKFSSAKQDWMAWKSERIAQGDRFEWVQLAPPDVLDAENFATAPFVAAAVVGKEAQVDPVFKSLSVTKGEWGGWKEGRRLDWATFQGDPFLENMQAHEKGLQYFRDAIHRAGSKIPMDYGEGELPGLIGMRSAAKAMALHAHVKLRNGKPGEALEDVLCLLRLSEHFSAEPCLIVNLLEVAVLNVSLQVIWEGIQAGCWSERELERLQQALMDVDGLASARLAWEGLRLNTINTFGSAAEGVLKTNEAGAGGSSAPVKKNWLGERFFYHNMIAFDRFFVGHYLDIIDPKAHRVYPERRLDIEAWQKKHRGRLDLTIARIAVPSLGGQLERQAQAQSYCSLAAVACALERHRLRAGHYPDRLQQLTAMNLISLPLDITTGNPLIYERRANQYLLYSVGWDQVDQKGALGWSTQDGKRFIKPEEGDWVWTRL